MTRSERLNRLVIKSSCNSSWEEMEGDGRRRFCAECQREVFDLALMTPVEIRARVEASHGNLCARLTREGGRLVTALPVALPEPAVPWLRRRAATFAAGLVTACLSAGATESQTAESVPAVAGPAADQLPNASPRQSAPAPGAALRGRVTTEGDRPLAGVEVTARNGLDGSERTASSGADGTFELPALPPGIYDLEGSRVGFEVTSPGAIALQPGEEQQADLTAVTVPNTVMLGGAMVALPEPLRAAYEESDLVVAAVVARSRVASRHDDLLDVVTDLRVDTRIKGSFARRTVAYHHAEYVQDGDRGNTQLSNLAAGTRVLAFLKRREAGRAGRGDGFESVDFQSGIKQLDEAAQAAYLARLEALARLEDDAERRGEMEPAALVEWLVGTVEDPHTRGEATDELGSAVHALAARAAQTGTSTEVAASDLQVVVDRFRDAGGVLSAGPRPEVLGAYLTAGQRARLAAALAATTALGSTNLGGPDLALFDMVRGWNERAAMDWLAQRLRAGGAEDDELETWTLYSLAERLHDEALRALAEEAVEQERAIAELWADDQSAATARLREERAAAVRQDVRRRFVAALASPR